MPFNIFNTKENFYSMVLLQEVEMLSLSSHRAFMILPKTLLLYQSKLQFIFERVNNIFPHLAKNNFSYNEYINNT